jgi:hypothetical protein
MGIATLMRIDNALKMLSAFQKVRHRRAVIRHLRELHKEVYPFLKPADRSEAWEYWRVINDQQNKPEVWERLDNFDFWLRDQLYSKGLLMNKSTDPALAVLKRG